MLETVDPLTPSIRSSATDRTAWFGQARVGLCFHWGLHALLARGEWAQHRERITAHEYARLLHRFHARRWRPEAWADAALAAGARYVVLPAKGFDGFCLFSTAFGDFSVRQTPFARDALLEAVEACRAADLRLGLAYALLDWRHPDHPVDDLHPLRDDPLERTRPRAAERYLRQVHGHLRELMSNYGRIDLVRFESGCAEIARDTWNQRELVEMVSGLQPQVMLTDGLGDVEGVDVATCDDEVPAGGPAREVGVLLNRHHGYARDDRAWIAGDELWRRVVDAAAAGANALIHVGIDAHGQVPPPALALLRDLGRRLRRAGDGVYGGGDAGLGAPMWGRWVAREGTVYAHVWQRPGEVLPVPELAGRVRAAWLLEDGGDVPLIDVDGMPAVRLPYGDEACVVAFDLDR